MASIVGVNLKEEGSLVRSGEKSKQTHVTFVYILYLGLITCEKLVGDGTGWLLAESLAPGFEVRLPTGDGEWGADEVLSVKLIAPPEVAAAARVTPGGLADLREAAMLEVDETEDVIKASGSLEPEAIVTDGMAPGGGGGATPAAVEALITAAAALGAVKLVRGTRGVWNTPRKRGKLALSEMKSSSLGRLNYGFVW